MITDERSSNQPYQPFRSVRQGYSKQGRHKKNQKNSYSKPPKTDSSNYYWSDRENKSYLRFLREKGYVLTLSSVERKRQKTNLKLSKFVKTRTPTQCHTHHQKMMNKYGTIQNIIKVLSEKFGLNNLEKEIVPMQSLQDKKQKQCADELANKLTKDQNQCHILKEQNDLEYIFY